MVRLPFPDPKGSGTLKNAQGYKLPCRLRAIRLCEAVHTTGIANSLARKSEMAETDVPHSLCGFPGNAQLVDAASAMRPGPNVIIAKNIGQYAGLSIVQSNSQPSVDSPK